ncbi:potassium transporter TrkG [Paracoccaceae bacterium GXU_MW_L88]
MLLTSAGMVLPMLNAAVYQDWETARTFFYHGLIFWLGSYAIGLAIGPQRKRQSQVRSDLITLIAAYALLPLMMAAPVAHLVPSLGFFGAYFEMVSCFTTTGATQFEQAVDLSATLHLWRAFAGWSGGLLIVLAAFVIFEPLNLGGFELLQKGAPGSESFFTQTISAGETLWSRYVPIIVPIYTGGTLTLTLLLILAGEGPLIALCHGMSVISTTGASPVGGLENGLSGRVGEVIVMFFFIFALTHRVYRPQTRIKSDRGINDPELILAAIAVCSLTLLLFMRHWLASFDFADQENIGAMASAVWGTFFTVLSFVTTTGFVSADWMAARDWSGLETTGLIFMGVSVIGGGIATTAGGIKLLRVYGLYRHGLREVQILAEPHSVPSEGRGHRQMRRQGAYLSWIFLMLFLVTLASLMLVLTLLGLGFVEAIAHAIAALATTGQLVPAMGTDVTDYGYLSSEVKAVLAIAMVMGRVESLALIALLNPMSWR